MTTPADHDSATPTASNLLAGLNHEIRTAMNGIAGMLELLRDSGLNAAQLEYAGRAQDGVGTLLTMIERVVDLSLIEVGRFPLAEVSFDLVQELQPVCTEKAAVARARGLELTCVYPASALLRGDPGRLRQLASSLIDAAVSLARPGPIAIRIEAACEPAGRCRLRFAAQTAAAGGACPAAPSDHPPHAGAALELALCARLAGLMGGDSGSDSGEAGMSIWFALDLPLAYGQRPGPRVPLEPATQLKATAQPIAGSRVLVADDNPVNREIAVRMLENLGCLAEPATDGQQAIDLHAAARYDLILMDCDMPHMDGYQATQCIRAMEGAGTRTPIVALTASTAPSEQEKCLAAGMDDFLSKPIRPQALKETLARWISSAPAMAEQAAPAACEDELDAVRDIFGADFAELAALYLRDSPPRLATLRATHAAGDHAQLAKVAHALSGSSASIGATGLSALCRELEVRAKAGAIHDIDKRLAAIETEYRRISDKLS